MTMTNLQILALLLTSPRQACIELQQRPRWWFPLLLTVIATLAVIIAYYRVVDFKWLAEQTLNVNPRVARMTPEQRQRAVAFISRNVMLGTSLVTVPLAFGAARLLEAGWYLLAGKVVGLQQSFRQWFSLACWAGLPGLISAAAGLSFILLSGNSQLATGSMAPLSVNELFVHLPAGARGATLLSSLTLVHPLIWGLTAVGVQTWTKRSWLFSVVYTLLPQVLVYGIWAAWALL
jgi:hypothetical protein